MTVESRSLTDLFKNGTLGSPDNAVGFVLWRIVHRYVREIDRALAPFDLTHLQFTVLAMTAWLLQQGESVTQVAIARFAHIHPMQVSQVLKVLDAKGLVARPRNSKDTRARCVAVTEAGVGSLRNAMPVAIAVQKRMFGAEGMPGGAFLETLLRLETLIVDQKRPPQSAPSSPDAVPSFAARRDSTIRRIKL